MILQRLGNRGMRLGELFDRAAARHPLNVVVLDHDLDVAPERGRRLTVAELRELVADLASWLWAADVRPGERVVIYKSNGFDIVLLACAVTRIGAVPVLLSPFLDGASAAELVRRTDRPHLITDEAKLRDELPGTIGAHAATVLTVRGEHPAGTPLDSWAGAPRVRPVSTPPNHPALVTHTSGTTGLPKLTVHTRWSLQTRYRPQAVGVGLVRSRETVAVHVSFVHSRMYSALTLALIRGFPVLVLVDEDPDRVAELFRVFRPGILEAHPNSFMAWEPLAADPSEPLANVKYFSSTFDAIHPRTIHRLLHASRRRFPLFAQLYGQSETGPIVARAFTKWRSEKSDGRCVGIPFPGMTDFRVIGRNGRIPTKESPGLIEVRSDGRAVTYLGEQERYDRMETGEWWRMGDVGYRTKWGCLHLLDREVDVIDGFGSTLIAEDKILASMEQLTELIIVPGAAGMAQPVVCTRADEPLDITAWRTATATLPAMHPPAQRTLAELPQTATRKVKRLELSRQLLGEAGP
ncbi:class I adenylate-forming enzyme family protein [Nocardia jiangsuensis]|uniref:Class I adenylate-forming enzyme family protein n=1 Tax=Nocardia jiangsuensis TaxID=1691563 RepID=A0ABV8E253_9NOCA